MEFKDFISECSYESSDFCNLTKGLSFDDPIRQKLISLIESAKNNSSDDEVSKEWVEKWLNKCQQYDKIINNKNINTVKKSFLINCLNE